MADMTGTEALDSVNAVDKGFRVGTTTDKSIGLTGSTGSDAVMTATTTPRKKGSRIVNPDTEDEPIYLRLGAAAAIPVLGTSATSEPIYPGSTYDLEGTYASVNVIAATAGHRIFAKEAL